MKRRIGIGVELDGLLRSLDETVELLTDRAGESQHVWAPAVDLLERGGETVLLVNLPGVDPDTLSVTVDRSSLTIAGSKERLPDRTERRYHLIERSFGPFEIVVGLRREPDPASCRARYDRGVLEVTVVYTARSRSRHQLSVEREAR